MIRILAALPATRSQMPDTRKQEQLTAFLVVASRRVVAPSLAPGMDQPDLWLL